jgi:hypothetical protein
MPEPRLFLDADGVLADFDHGAQRLLGMTPKAFIAKHGRGAFWRRLANARNFYGSLPEMPDARLLFTAHSGRAAYGYTPYRWEKPSLQRH